MGSPPVLSPLLSVLFHSGGAGNRTLVRVWFQNRIYVRRSLFKRLPDPARNRPLRGLPPDVSPRASEDHAQPARICDPIHRAPGGLSEPEVRQASLAQLTQPAPGYRWRLVVSKRFSQGLGPGHAAIPSSNPSKPIAPGCVIMIHTRPVSGNRPPPPSRQQTRKHERTKARNTQIHFAFSCFRVFVNSVPDYLAFGYNRVNCIRTRSAPAPSGRSTLW